MQTVVTPLIISNQLEQLENFVSDYPDLAEIALNDLGIISNQINEMITGLGVQLTPADMVKVQKLMERVSTLSDRLLKETPIGITLEKINELKKTIK